MFLNRLNLTNFRNYENQCINFIKGINLFVGDNAQGKTNIIESIYLSSFGKSYRATKDVEMINLNKDFLRVQLDYNKKNIDNKVEIYIDKLNKKIIKKNEIKIKKISDYIGEIPIVIFSPDSLDIIKGSPSKRRNFIDMICSQISKSYLICLQEYNKCLKLKNSMLKKDIVDKDYIFVLHEKMSEYIVNIVKYRKKIIEKILEKAKIIEMNLTNNKENINLHYNTDFSNLEKKEIKDILDEHLYIELLRKSSVKGIQRDDISIYINDLEVEKFGSQGQNRTAMLSLKLANFEVLKDIIEEEPILLLDDIMSELDENRINFLLKYIQNYQSIITTTDSKFVKDIDNINILKVLNGRLEI